MSSSVFPNQVDNFQYMTDVSASDASNINTYQQLLMSSNLTPTQQQQLTSLTQTLTSAGKILDADAWNHLIDAVTAVQSYFLNTVNSDINNMENEFAAKVAKFSDQGAYNSATNYMDMNFVTWNGQSYICKQDNTVGIDPSHTSNWALVAQKGDKGDQGVPGAALSYVGTYNSASTYQQNQLVTYNGSTYICLQNNTTNILPTNTAYWTLFVTGATPIAQSSAPTNPTINQLWIDTTSSTNPLLKYWDGSQWDLVPAPATTSELGLVLISATPQTGYPVAVSTIEIGAANGVAPLDANQNVSLNNGKGLTAPGGAKLYTGPTGAGWIAQAGTSTSDVLAAEDSLGNLVFDVTNDHGASSEYYGVISGRNVATMSTGGYKMVSDVSAASVSVAGTSVTATYAFPKPFSSVPNVDGIAITSASVGTAGYINVAATSISSTSITFTVNSYVAQTIQFGFHVSGI